MSETDRAGQIRLSIDQEVFIESVANGDTVEDANVATEVTSFERVGDAYVLEGAIVFAGYLTRAAQGNEPVAGVSEGAGYGKHIHHRMPFMLRVPVQYQQRGVVNVASRISDWELEVIGDGWLHVDAMLTIHGLNGKQGFHFQCGAQEEGDVFFGRRPKEQSGTQDEATAETTAVPAVDDSTQSEPELELVRGGDDWRSAEDEESSPDDSVADDEASDETESTHREIRTRSESDDQVTSIREELLSLDRYVREDGESRTSGEEMEAVTGEPSKADAATSAEAETTSEAGAKSESAVPERFEVEHQVDVTRLSPEPQADPQENAAREAQEFTGGRNRKHSGEQAEVRAESPSEESADAQVGSDHSTVAAETGAELFAADEGDEFRPKVRLGASAEMRSTETEDAETDEEGASRGPLVDASLWSFVDFNAPDSSATVRYAIVMEDESLERVAERVGCLESALVQANELRGDGVVPGQVLRVPDNPTIPFVQTDSQ